MKTNARITILCDACNYTMDVELCATASGWDERGIDEYLEFEGWDVLNENEIQHVCPRCVKYAKSLGFKI